jgi:uncharacterized protein
MKEYRRPQYEIVAKWLTEKRKFIQVISGPRQVGKTTLISQLLDRSVIPNTYISADSVIGSGRSWIESHWEAARFAALKNVSPHILAIDEIQKIPGWSSVIKALWDEDSFRKNNIKLILSGSSGLLLHQGLTESLAGRFELTSLSHWSLAEMQKAFRWTPEQYVWFGGYPGSASLIDNESRWKVYVRESLVEPTISKDILNMTRIDKPALLRQMFDLGCHYSGEILSYNKMLGQLQDAGNTVTLAGYLNLLNQAGLLTGLEKFSGSIVRQKLSSPKLIVRNTALMSSAWKETFRETVSKPEIWGRIVESAVGAHLINSCETRGISVYYWRDGNDEVDYVLSSGRNILAIEVKSGKRQTKRGLEKFKKSFSGARAFTVGEGGIPWQDFLLTDPQKLFKI